MGDTGPITFVQTPSLRVRERELGTRLHNFLDTCCSLIPRPFELRKGRLGMRLVVLYTGGCRKVDCKQGLYTSTTRYIPFDDIEMASCGVGLRRVRFVKC